MTPEADHPIEAYNPVAMEPATVEEAHVLAVYYNGQRIPRGHPLSFENLRVPPGLYVYGALPSDPDRKRTHLRLSDEFWSRIRVPALVLGPGGGSMTDPQVRVTNRFMAGGVTEGTLGYFSDIAGTRENAFIALFRKPQGGWDIYPFAAPDIYKDADVLLQEYRSVSRKDPVHRQYVRNMKVMAYYLVTGQVLARP